MPFILLDIVHLARAEENVLNTVIAAHHVNLLAVHDGSMFLTHLDHTSFRDNFTLGLIELIDCRRRAAASDQGITVWESDGSSIVHEV